MKIEYLGHSCFRITAKNGTKIVTDPYTGVGYELPPDLQANIVTVSHAHFDHNYLDGVQGVEKIISEIRVREEKEILFEGILTDHDPKNGTLRGRNTVFKITTDGITVCHLGDLGEPYSPKLIEKIGKIDILLIPVGGNYTIDAKQALAYIHAINPAIAIPMHYRPQDGTIDIAEAEEFLKLCQEYIIIKEKGVYEPTDFGSETKIVFMERE